MWRSHHVSYREDPRPQSHWWEEDLPNQLGVVPDSHWHCPPYCPRRSLGIHPSPIGGAIGLKTKGRASSVQRQGTRDTVRSFDPTRAARGLVHPPRHGRPSPLHAVRSPGVLPGPPNQGSRCSYEIFPRDIDISPGSGGPTGSPDWDRQGILLSHTVHSTEQRDERCTTSWRPRRR